MGNPNKRKKRQKAVKKRMNVMRNNVSDCDIKQSRREDQKREDQIRDEKERQELQQRYDKMQAYLHPKVKVRTLSTEEMREWAKNNTVAHVVGRDKCPACEAGIPNHPQGEYDGKESQIEKEETHTKEENPFKEGKSTTCKFKLEDGSMPEMQETFNR